MKRQLVNPFFRVYTFSRPPVEELMNDLIDGLDALGESLEDHFVRYEYDASAEECSLESVPFN